MPTKPALASVTIWGLIFATLCTTFPGIAAYFHLGDADTQKAIQSFVGEIGTLISLGIALYGRFHTSTPIAGVLKTPAASAGGLPPAGANLLVALLFVPALALVAIGSLTGCASVSAVSSAPTTSSAVLSALGSVTAAVNAHPAATDQGRQDAELAFVVSANGVEALYRSGMLGGANVSTARSDLETAYKVLVTARTALTLAGAVPSATLVSDEALSDAAYARVDAELVAT